MKVTRLSSFSLLASVLAGPIGEFTNVKRADVAELHNLLQRDVSVADWLTLLTKGSQVWSQVSSSLDEYPELKTQVNGFVAKAITSYSSSQHKRELDVDLYAGSEYLTARDVSSIIDSLLGLLTPIVSSLLGSLDWNSIIVNGGKYLVSVAEQVWEWAVSSGNWDKFVSWLGSNLGSILSSLLSSVLGLFTGSSTSTTSTAAAAAAATSGSAKRMLY